MNNRFPVPPSAYRVVLFSEQYLLLFRFHWLNDNLSVSYYFICFNLVPIESKRGRIKITYAADSTASNYDASYFLEYLQAEGKLFISFLNDRFEVVCLRHHEASGKDATILELRSSAGEISRFYGATSDPFNVLYNKIYGIPRIR
ncbi:hypothetical protein LL912_06060 [Niabella sp. CC-SYL272]|uniref:hypothetical protein n=1 Tax=Niabella agricola TaxID=2891571 RepID=UPI001F1D3097|nr:hypothetical protein [Niabella agricola]MCF3108336.1 hypothetical protein [Niabella agricola]